MTECILMQAGTAAAAIKDEILEMMDLTVGDPNGISSTSHTALATRMLSNMGPEGASAFDKVLDFSIQDLGASEINAIIRYCRNDPRNLGKLIKRLREVSDDDTEAHILKILGAAAKDIPETRSIVIPELTSRITHPCISVVAGVADTLFYLDAFDATMEEPIRNRRESQKDSECAGYSREPPEDFGLPDSPLDRSELLALLKADDPYDRAFAAEKLRSFAQDPDVSSALSVVNNSSIPLPWRLCGLRVLHSSKSDGGKRRRCMQRQTGVRTSFLQPAAPRLRSGHRRAGSGSQ
ncbi:MAG: hypothetical protein JW706_08725 [Opitutales bacterium]|nr:hypothetical protein [Opitutales bacterium]